MLGNGLQYFKLFIFDITSLKITEYLFAKFIFNLTTFCCVVFRLNDLLLENHLWIVYFFLLFSL